MEYSHTSVLLNESIEYLNIKPNGIYVDGTLGGGGHSLEICKRLSQEGRLLGIDQDDFAINFAKERLKDFKNVTYVRNNFSHIQTILDELSIEKIDGAILD
jgi:16S rRNA (cytosine1402-N4)-methyltransferase